MSEDATAFITPSGAGKRQNVKISSVIPYVKYFVIAYYHPLFQHTPGFIIKFNNSVSRLSLSYDHGNVQHFQCHGLNCTWDHVCRESYDGICNNLRDLTPAFNV